MKIRLPKTEKKVIVDEKRKTVTTLLLGTENKAIKFVGVAKCSPEDTFDVEIGAKISYRRARRAMLVAIRNEVRAEIKKGEEYAKAHQDIYDDLTKSIEELRQSVYDIVE